MSQIYPNSNSLNFSYSSPSTTGYALASHSHTITAPPPPAPPMACSDCGALLDQQDIEAMHRHARWHKQFDCLLSVWDSLGEKIRSTVRDDLEDLLNDLGEEDGDSRR